jgi:hypothetical protein
MQSQFSKQSIINLLKYKRMKYESKGEGIGHIKP